eukprot:Seg1580.7 transcript_id=Seg1580.7/GoldUCD/mRNA.D3Y31 product="RWD domain-containing protein 2B" protein_id=Seg1580.7/GoldUCD/D3Y31
MEDGAKAKLLHYIDCFETQLTELETLQCIFMNDGEFTISNPIDVDRMRTICERFRSETKTNTDLESALLNQIGYLKCVSLDLQLKIELENEVKTPAAVHVNIALPHLYPKDELKVFISSDTLTRELQGDWNRQLVDYVKQTSTGDPIIYQIIEWLKESGEDFLRKSIRVSNEKSRTKSLDESNAQDKTLKKGAIWLYMHHIYSKNKRKDIINWADELELTGFSLPGKPGVVYVEGDMNNVDDYFSRLKRLQWKRMSCVHRETHESGDLKRIFGDFQELCFDVSGGRDYHMDMGKFQIFLKEHCLGHMFTILFGLKDS